MASTKDKILARRTDSIRPQTSDSIRATVMPKTRQTEEQRLESEKHKKGLEKAIARAALNRHLRPQGNTPTNSLVDQIVAQQAAALNTTQSEPQVAQQSEQKQTTPPPAVPAAQTTEEVKPAPQPAVLTPEQTAAERNRIAADTSATMDAQHANNLKQLNYDNIAKMLNEASAAGQAQQAAKAEAEEKRRRRSALFNAIGDGVAALSNLYFTTKGAPSVNYNPTNSLSERSRARWDEIDKNRQAELERAYLRQDQTLKQQIDNERQRRAEERQARKDAADEAYRQGQAAAAQRRHEETMAYNRERDKRDQEKWEKELSSKEKIAQINQAGQTKRAEMKASSNSGDSIRIGDNEYVRVPMGEKSRDIFAGDVFSALPQYIQDAAREEFGTKSSNPLEKNSINTAQMLNAIGKYITHKDAAAARKIMRERAGVSTVEDEDYSQYEVSNDEDYSQYEVK